MSDITRDRFDAADEDRLPWLEAVEEEDDEPGVGAGRLIAALIAGLIAIGLIVGGVYWLRQKDAAGGPGEGELIAAPEGSYKERPENPGGMQVEGTGDIAYGASEGADVNSTLDLTALPEAPVTPPGELVAEPLLKAPPPTPAPKAAPAARQPRRGPRRAAKGSVTALRQTISSPSTMKSSSGRTSRGGTCAGQP